MTVRGYPYVVAALLLVRPVPAPAADSLESIERRIGELREKIKTITYDQEQSVEIKRQGFSAVSVNKSANEGTRNGTKWLSRTETKTVAGQKVDHDSDTNTDATSLTISDGTFSYTIAHTQGLDHAIKKKADSWDQVMGAARFFEKLREGYDLKVLPGEEVNGKPAFVIEGVSKPAAPNRGRTLFYLDHDNGLVVQILFRSDDGTFVQSMKLSNIHVNVAVSPDRFVFKAPEGVAVEDLTESHP
jgi:outer membrane lipoprotein-sorting protein